MHVAQETLGRIGVVATVACGAAIVLMHVVQPDMDPADVAVSYYMNGRLGWVLGLGLVVLGIGSLALAAGIRALLGDARPRAGLWLFALWAIGAIIGGIFPPDPYGQWDRPPSVPGMIHGVAGIVAFLAFSPGAWLLSKAVSTWTANGAPARMLAPLAGLSLLVLLLLFVCMAPVFADRPPFALGLVERVLLALNLGWIGIASWIVATRVPAPIVRR
jgi:hypothetical protein